MMIQEHEKVTTTNTTTKSTSMARKKNQNLIFFLKKTKLICSQKSRREESEQREDLTWEKKGYESMLSRIMIRIRRGLICQMMMSMLSKDERGSFRAMMSGF